MFNALPPQTPSHAQRNLFVAGFPSAECFMHDQQRPEMLRGEFDLQCLKLLLVLFDLLEPFIGWIRRIDLIPPCVIDRTAHWPGVDLNSNKPNSAPI
jgi:hypothetical protein